jgi:hypothetical protein
MYKVGIIGHTFEELDDLEKITRSMHNTIELLNHQYGGSEFGESNLILNLGAERGLELLAGEYCLEKKIKYHLFLSNRPEIFTDDTWFDDQRNKFNKQFNNAFSATICSSSLVKKVADEIARDKLLVNDSNFIVYFWSGKKTGRVYESMIYALNTNKIALNGTDNLKLITNDDLRKDNRWKSR